MLRHPPISTLFPTRRSSDLGLEDDLNTARALGAVFDMVREANTAADRDEMRQEDRAPLLAALDQFDEIFAVLKEDRKSTRLNSSHLGISYAVFCLKKKKQQR